MPVDTGCNESMGADNTEVKWHQNKYPDVSSHLEDARMEALSPPKQERATAKGIVQFITPNTWSANVWKEIKWCKAELDKYGAEVR